MYFEQFMNGGASQEPVSHVDILMLACEGAEFCGDAEVALIEEDGRLCMTVGSEGIGDAMAAVADKAKEIGTKIWKWLVEFVRKVRAFVSQAIVSLRSGAIYSALKRIIAKGKSKAKNDDWNDNAPKPERVTKWNIDVKRAVNGIWFISPTAVEKLEMTSGKLASKLTGAMGKSSSFGGDGAGNDGTYKKSTGSDGKFTSFNGPSDNDGELDSILNEIPKVSSDGSDDPSKHYNRDANGDYTAGRSTNTKWLMRAPDTFVNELKLDSDNTNRQIIEKSIKAANLLANTMTKDPILKTYDILKLLDTEVNFVKKLCSDAGKAGAKELKRIKKIQKAVSKVGTTCTLFCRRQLGSYKKATALVMRLYSMAGSMEKDDYKED